MKLVFLAGIDAEYSENSNVNNKQDIKHALVNTEGDDVDDK